MNREEALDKANTIVDQWIEPKVNQRGYVHDAWKPTDIKARVEAVLELANFLWDLPEEEVPDSTVPEPLPGLRPPDPS